MHVRFDKAGIKYGADANTQTWYAGPQGQVCYYSGPQDALYEKLGHAEVVQVELDGSKAQQEMQKYADVSLHSLSRWIQVIYDYWTILVCQAMMTLTDIMQGASRQSPSHAHPSISDCSCLLSDQLSRCAWPHAGLLWAVQEDALWHAQAGSSGRWPWLQECDWHPWRHHFTTLQGLAGLFCLLISGVNRCNLAMVPL